MILRASAFPWWSVRPEDVTASLSPGHSASSAPFPGSATSVQDPCGDHSLCQAEAFMTGVSFNPDSEEGVAVAHTKRVARNVQGVLFQFFVVAAVALPGVSQIQAQTLSIVNMDSSREAILLEASLKRFLRADGYTVLGYGTEGYVVLLHGMSATTTGPLRVPRQIAQRLLGRQGPAARRRPSADDVLQHGFLPMAGTFSVGGLPCYWNRPLCSTITETWP